MEQVCITEWWVGRCFAANCSALSCPIDRWCLAHRVEGLRNLG